LTRLPPAFRIPCLQILAHNLWRLFDFYTATNIFFITVSAFYASTTFFKPLLWLPF